jgi:hypothetical protein
MLISFLELKKSNNMEKGMICVTDGIIFAYRGKIPGHILHYVCVLRDGTVRVYKHGGTGKLSDDEDFREAEPHEISRFHEKLYSHGYRWNVANCVIIDDTTSEILQQE